MTLDKVKLKTINNQSVIGDGNISVGGSSVDIVTSWSSTTSDTKVPSEKLTKNSLDGKSDTGHTHTKSQITDFPTLATVATTGDYDDLLDKPNIPSKISDLTNDSDFIEKSNTQGLVKNDGSIDTTNYSTFTGSYNDLSNKPSIPSASSDLSDGSDLVKKSNTTGLLKNDGTVDTTSYLSSSAIVDLIYPVGSIYMSVNSTSPQTLFGGTWERIKDTFLLASGDTYSNGATGGEASHTLTTDEMPSHTHTQNAHSHTIGSLARYPVNGNGNAAVGDGYGNTQNYKTGDATATNKNTGGGQAHNNMPPYLAVYVWKRTA